MVTRICPILLNATLKKHSTLGGAGRWRWGMGMGLDTGEVRSLRADYWRDFGSG